MPRSPIFIVGSPRSGTSILVDAVISVGYEGYREGNFLTLMTTLERLIDRHFQIFAGESTQVLVSQVDAGSFKRDIQDVFRSYMERLNSASLWFDKTGNPEMIEAIPTLRRFWPDSGFIFAKRRAIENLISRQKKFPNLSFEYHCADWAKNMSSWRRVRAGIPSDAYAEMDQQDLIRSPDASAQRLSEFLQLPADRKEVLMRTFESNRPQQTVKGSAERILSLGSVQWTAEQLAIFEKHCVPEMDAYGYSTDENYKKPGAA